MSEAAGFLDDAWDGTDGAEAFARPGERGYAATEPEPEPVQEAADPDLELVQSDPAGALEALRQGAQLEEGLGHLGHNLVVGEAVRRYEDGEEAPDVIADQLRDTYGYEVAAPFVQHWHADETQWDDDTEIGPETAAEWVALEERRAALVQAFQQSQQEQRATEQQAQLDVEINAAFNEGVVATRARHAALSKGRAGVTSEELLPIINQLGANVNPSTPEEARVAGEQLYRQAVEMVRAMQEAEMVTSLDSPHEKALRRNYMPGEDQREERRTALSPIDEQLNYFVERVDPSRAMPRPTLEQSLHADFDAAEARQRAFEDAFQVIGDGPTNKDLRPANRARQKPRAQTVAEGWNV